MQAGQAVSASALTTLEGRLSAGVYARIFEGIVAGEYRTDARLPSESALAERFGASRPVVREALARLREDGLIVSRRGSGSYVKRRPDAQLLRFAPVHSIADIQRLFEFRAGLEGVAAALAAERWEDADMARIKDALAGLERAIARREIGVEADAAFHRAVAQATRNPYHVAVEETLAGQIAFGMNLTRHLSLRSAERLRRVQDEHVAIVTALETRDAGGARTAMERHIENARRRMFDGVTDASFRSS